MKKWLFILLLPCLAFSEGRDSCNCDRSSFIQISSLPYTISTTDTCYALASNLSATGTGITISTSDVFFTLAGDTITWNTGDNSDTYGIFISAPGGANRSNVTIRGGTIIYGGDATTGSDNFGLYISGTVNTLIDSLNIVGGGYDGKAVQLMSEVSPLKLDSIYFRGGHYATSSRYYHNRQTYDGSVFHFSSPGYSNTSRDYDIKMVGVHIDSGYNVGVVTAGSAALTIPDNCAIIQIDGCTTYTDTRNFAFEWDVCTCTPYSPCDVSYSSVNSYPFLITYAREGTYVKNCKITTGTDYLGAPGISFENVLGTSTDTVKCSANYIDAHQGPKGEANSINGNICSLIRQRSIDGGETGYIAFLDNHVLLTCDSGDCGEDDVTPAWGIAGDACWLSLQYTTDTGHVLVRGNTFEARIKDISKTGNTLARAFSYGPVTPEGFHNTVVEYNHFISDDIIVGFGHGYDCDSILLNGDTLEFTDSCSGNAGRATFYVNDGDGTVSDVRVRDVVYVNGASDEDVVYAGAGTSEIFFEKTMTLNVVQSGSPVSSAACTVWNAYTDEILTGTTNGSGIFSGVVTYRYDSYTGDSTGYNPFTIHVWKNSDSAWGDSNVVWNDAEYTFTLSGGSPAKTRTRFKK